MLIPFHMNAREYNLLWYQKASRVNVQYHRVNRHMLQENFQA